MVITLFHRATSDAHEPPCDVASISVTDVDGNPAGFIGSAWGEHAAADALHVGVCAPEDVDQVLAGWGLRRPEPSTIDHP